MAVSRPRRLVLIAGIGLLAVAGTAAAYLLKGRRDVTTSSDVAYRLYREGLENEFKLYSREAVNSYAEALKHDPHFLMATVRLATQLKGRDPERAKGLLQCASRFVDEVTPRERLLFDIVGVTFERDNKKLESLVTEYRRRYPNDPEGFQRQAELLSMTGRSDEAVRVWEQLVALDPNFAAPYNQLGYYWLGRGEIAKSEEYFKRYRFLAPDQANPHDSLGEMYAAVGRYDEAEEALRKALTIKPDFFPAFGHLGTVELGRGRYDKAAEYFRKAADLLEGQARFEFGVAAVFSWLDAGDTKRAEQEAARVSSDLEKSIGSERAFSDSHLPVLRAVVFLRTGRAREAREALEPIRQKLPGLKDQERKDLESALLMVEGGIAHSEGRHEEAVEKLRAGLAAAAGDKSGSLPYYDTRVAPRLALADSLRHLGRPAEAAEALEPILSRNPNHHAAALALASIRQGSPGPDEVHASRR